MGDSDRPMWWGWYENGIVKVSDASAVKWLASIGMGSMRIYHKNTVVSRTKNGSKVKATDLDCVEAVNVDRFESELVALDSSNDIDKKINGYDLLLTEEESIYLSHHKQLQVVDVSTQLSMTMEEIFEIFSNRRGKRTFLAQYAVYSFFKDRKFVVKSGINFGMDYCIYRDTPEKVHSEMCVRVVDALYPPSIVVESGDDVSKVRNLPYRNYESEYSLAISPVHPDYLNFQECEPGSLEQMNTMKFYYDNLSWKTLSTVTRVMPDVMKLGILCYVLPKDWDLSVEKAQSSNGISDSNLASITTFPPAPVRYGHLFCSDSSKSLRAPNSPTEIEEFWTVRPVSILVRRLPVNNTKYPRVDVLQQRYRAGAKLNNASSNASEALDLEGGDGTKKKTKRKKDFKKKVKLPVESIAPTTGDDMNMEHDLDNINEGGGEEHDVNDINISEGEGDALTNADEIIYVSLENDEESKDIPNESSTTISVENRLDLEDDSTLKRPREEDIDHSEREYLEINDSNVQYKVDLSSTVGGGANTAFKRIRVRRDVEVVREKSQLTKKASIWELLNSP